MHKINSQLPSEDFCVVALRPPPPPQFAILHSMCLDDSSQEGLKQVHNFHPVSLQGKVHI